MKRNGLTRREVVAGFSSLSLLPVACRSVEVGRREARADLFRHGVASGDPDHRSVVLWTRISQVDEAEVVRWSVAQDPGMQNVVTAGTAITDASRDHTVKALATGLQAGRVYYYRFEFAGVTSPLGRTRTLPRGRTERLGIAVASCANYPLGYFHAYRAIADRDDVDFVLHLGDYIYEYAADGWGFDSGTRMGRLHLPAHEPVTLDDYRQRHEQYKGDPDLQRMHARHPCIVLWDDHETANNPWMGGAENHRPEQGAWAARREASLRAWYEWMPVREQAPGMALQDYWRYYRFGDLAGLLTLETRHSGRSQEISLLEHLQLLDQPGGGDRFRSEVLGAPERHVLSGPMRRFLESVIDDDRQGTTPWRLIASPTLMAEVRRPPLREAVFTDLLSSAQGYLARKLPAVRRMGELDLPREMGDWSAYPAARERFFSAWSSRGFRDLLVLAGDSHGFWANRLRDGGGQAMGVELGTAGISSPGDSLIYGPEGGPLMDRLFAEHNEQVVWTDSMHCGYLQLNLAPERARAEFIAVSDPEAMDFSVTRLCHGDIFHTGGSLDFDGFECAAHEALLQPEAAMADHG